MLRRFGHGLCLILLCALWAQGAGTATAEDSAEARLVGYVEVRGDGFVRMTKEQLAQIDIQDGSRLRVSLRGAPVPICAPSHDGALTFLARGTVARNTATARFALHEMPSTAPRPPMLQPERVAVTATSTPCVARLILADDRVFGPVDGGSPAIYDHAMPTWFLSRLDHQGRATQSLDPRWAEGAQTLTARVYGTYVHPVAVRAVWGTTDLGLAEAVHAAGGATLRWSVPADALPAGPAPLVLTNRSSALPPKPGNDLSRGRGRLWIDAIALEGPAHVRIGRRIETWSLGGRNHVDMVFVDTPGPVAALLLGADGRARATVSTAAAAGRYRLDLPGERATHLVAGPIKSGVVVPATAVDPLAAVGDARHVIIAAPRLLDESRRLADHRRKHGLASAAVDVRDVYAAFGHGSHDAAAIHAFVAALKSRDAPLEYLLLAGDAIHDRTDWSKHPMIPPPMARTLWNGATPSDALYAGPIEDSPTSRTVVGRLPFRRAETMASYVNRLIVHETRSRPDPNRRLLRFFAGGTNMGHVVDALFERAFRNVLDEFLDPAFDVEVTNANPRSPYFWPLFQMNDKIIRDINTGSLIYTYVGHGTDHESDRVAAWDGDLMLMTHREIPHVQVMGVCPVMLVLASGTGAYDLPKRDGIGEALLKRPEGPLAYWGATRFCNPIFNCLAAAGLAKHAASAERVGDLVEGARSMMYAKPQTPFAKLVLQFARASWPDVPEDRIRREGVATYALLGDPALRMVPPTRQLALDARVEGREVVVTIRPKAALAKGTKVDVLLLRRRNDASAEPAAVEAAENPANADAVRAVYAKVNDHRLASTTVTWTGTAPTVRLPLPEGLATRGVRVVAVALTQDDILDGVLVLD